jgi:RNA polymerase sigma-54 factor
VSQSYRELCHEAFKDRARYLRTEWEQAQHYVERAQWFIHSIRKRRQTMREITESVVEVQRAFLDTSAEEQLKPLTRARIASLVGKHESTVSRAISGKLVLLPSGRMMKFEKFFAPAQAIKSVIEDLVGRESPDSPLTDDQICRALHVRGYHIARRTVAKYRLALRIPSSEQRRRMAAHQSQK